jgi:hypothetical protein
MSIGVFDTGSRIDSPLRKPIRLRSMSPSQRHSRTPVRTRKRAAVLAPPFGITTDARSWPLSQYLSPTLSLPPLTFLIYLGIVWTMYNVASTFHLLRNTRNSATSLMACDWLAQLSLRSLVSRDNSPLLADVIGKDVGAAETDSKKAASLFDVISIGSLLRRENQVAQRSTWGAHGSIRYFFPYSEEIDVESSCHSNLTFSQVERIVSHCRGSPLPSSVKEYRLSSSLDSSPPPLHVYHELRRRHLPAHVLREKGGSGWLCAQKRPLDALYSYLRRDLFALNNSSTTREESAITASSTEFLPDQLLIVDDDTFIGMDRVAEFVDQSLSGSVDRPIARKATAGCLVHIEQSNFRFQFPWGGFGLLLSRDVLQRLIQPIDCVGQQNQETCELIRMNMIGEQSVFKSGMSLIELAHAYVHAAPYLQIDEWSHDDNARGLCLHSDWLWGYILNTYVRGSYSSESQHLLNGYKNSTAFGCDSCHHSGKSSVRDRKHVQKSLGLLNECGHSGNAKCDEKSSFCHGVSPDRMYHLWKHKPKQ